MEQGTEFGLVDLEDVESPGDEWEEIDVSETDADRIARKRDRKFEQFEERIKDADQFKVEQSVFDDATLAALYKLVQDGYVDAFGGPLSTGKEANVYLAQVDDREVAVKIYRINASNFTQMRDYLEGDPASRAWAARRKTSSSRGPRRNWRTSGARRRPACGCLNPSPPSATCWSWSTSVPRTTVQKRLGEVHIENPQTAYEVMREYMRRLYSAGLIHGDLSEYNVVFDESEGQLVFIDLGQAVTVHHPNSREFLERDCRNVANFFSRQGLEVAEDDLFEFVTSPEPDPSRS